MSLNLIVIASFVVILGLTILLFIYIKRFITWITLKLEKLHPGYVADATPRKRNPRGNLLVTLNILLVAFIGIFYLSGDLGDTVLNREFVIDEVQNSNIVTMGTELLDKQSTDQLIQTVKQLLGQRFVIVEAKSDELLAKVNDSSPDQLFLADAVEATLSEQEATLKTQVLAALNSYYDYLTEKTPGFDIEIPLVDLQKGLRQNLQAAILKSPTPAMSGATPEQLQSYADGLYQDNFSHIPDQLKFSVDTSPSYVAVPLNQLRQFATHLNIISTAFLVGIVLLMVAITLVQRNIKQSLWTLGATLLITGVVDFLYLIIARTILSKANGLSFLPAINAWLIDVASDVLMIICQPFTLMMLIGGVMLGASILWPMKNRPKTHPAASNPH